jgi:hypothetical protein
VQSRTWGLIPSRGKRFNLLRSIQTSFGGYQAIVLSSGGLSPEVKQLGHGSDDSSPSSTEVKMCGLHVQSPIHLHGIIQGGTESTDTS